MFGCCVAGRLLQTNLTQVDDTHAYFELPNASAINHVCVFLLGDVPFPEGFGCAVHLYWPGKGFQLLGMLSNEKPSAIFRLRSTFSSSTTSATQDRFSSFLAAPNDVIAILGLSIEPLAQLQVQLASLQSAGVLVESRPDLTRDPAALAERIVKHLFNYISGFTGGGVTPEVAVPMSLIAKWYESFLGKVRAGGVGFLERAE
ncbi:hypothetical protein CPB83DRAFT_818788 [Crepidotus variabilis]|uniref:Hikeshi-like domain-containing protein n=1 Tax=Crepidotus variabilis TaxID=179855 RepID=A0A9P6JLJ8_9AGAR|nr:hypothetical protein CPB83DRAFT_818788 [Crepidotus variabilis]